ncbi:MAG TPA: PQQ-dependent sugar dehydrogenase [Candidatus Saccharimonas sp.]|nr:PQQ-dependent sugar dehydrogenase [Candidatus Saccharimonas sp.]
MSRRGPLGLYRVEGASMEPAYQAGDLLLGLRWFRPRAGQVVVAWHGGRPLIKRLTGLTPDGVWLAGDNAAASTDSRHFGALPHSAIEALIISKLPAPWLAPAILAVLLVLAAALVAGRPSGALAPRSSGQPTTSASPAATPAPYAVSSGAAPGFAATLPPGYVIHQFASGLGAARDLVFTPGGTLLVSNPDARTVTALPDANHDGLADSAAVILHGGEDTHGLAFYQGQLYVAELTRVVRYHWDESTLTASFDKALFDLPSPNPDHNKRTLAISPDGRLFVSVGSTCNVCHEPDGRDATVIVSDTNGASPRVYATGLRNAAFLAINPATGELWSTEMGRDYLGDNLPPDEIDLVRDGQDYGWPICYGDRVHDTSFDHNTYIADPCARTAPPLWPVPAHNAPLGLAFIKSAQFPADQQGDLLVAYHGSWNRTVPDGYKVVRLHVQGNTITGSTDFLTGFISGRTVSARPVDLVFDATGSLYLSDDKTGTIYIIQKQP